MLLQARSKNIVRIRLLVRRQRHYARRNSSPDARLLGAGDIRDIK